MKAEEGERGRKRSNTGGCRSASADHRPTTVGTGDAGITTSTSKRQRL
jgi:hypothetical protein